MTTKILVVDDSAVIRHVVSKGLADKGYDVISAINGYEGLEILRDVEVDAVISDYCMPVMNGYVFLEAVRKDFPDLPFIFFTSEIDRYISTSLQDQLCCLVAKTGSIDSLGEVLEQVAARSGTVGIVSDDTVSLWITKNRSPPMVEFGDIRRRLLENRIVVAAARVSPDSDFIGNQIELVKNHIAAIDQNWQRFLKKNMLVAERRISEQLESDRTRFVQEGLLPTLDQLELGISPE